MMSEMDIDALAHRLIEKLKESGHGSWLDNELHFEQHEFITILMEERAERVRRRKALEDKIAGSLILTGIVGLIGLLGAGTLDWMRTHLK